MDLWAPPFCEAENNYPENSLAQNFYFTQNLDILEEDALNEKCCVQVLKVLIAKADTEIAELEDEVVILQSQLACTDEKWFELCVATLNEKIDHLDSLMATLKNENVQGSGVHLQTNRKPPERIHEILKPLLKSFFSPQDKQQPTDSYPGSSKLGAADLIKIEATDNHNSKDSETVEVNGGFAAQANVTVQTPSVVQVRNHQDTSLCAVVRGEAHSSGTTKRKNNISEGICEDELIEQSSKGDRIIINSPPEIKETRNREGPKHAVAIVETAGTTPETRLIAVKLEPQETRDEQTQNGGKAGQTREKHTSRQLVRKKQTGAKSLVGIKGQEVVCSETGHTIEKSRQDLLNPKKKDRSKPLEKSEGKLQEKHPHQSQELVVHESNSKLSLNLGGQRLKFKFKFPPEMFREACLAEELGLRSRSGLIFKRQWKAETTKNDGGDDFGDKRIKESPLLLEGKKDIPEICSTPLTHLKKRRITSSRGPVLQENENLRDFQNRLVKSHDRSNQIPQVIKAENDEPFASRAFIVPTPAIEDLENMTFVQLKAVAKQENLRGICKRRKAELQELLRSKLLVKDQST